MDEKTGLPSYPDKFFDLAIVDPPYGIGASKDSRLSGEYKVNIPGGICRKVAARNYKKKDWDSARPDVMYFKQLKRVSKNQIIWGGNYFALPGSPCWLVWDKQNGENNNADCELAWTSFSGAVRKAKFKWNGMLQADMKQKENRIHPTQKPVKLYRWLLENYAKPGQLILDTHVGSASSLIACESMGFDYVGFEIDPDYYAAAKNRMSKGIQAVLI